MSTSLFDLFKFSKLLDVSNGKLVLMGTPINIIPTSILCNEQKMLIKTLGMEVAYQQLYKESKAGSYNYNMEFIKTQKFTDKHKIIDWQTKIVAFAGWGELQLALLDSDNFRVIIHFKDSPYPKSYGPAKYPIDFIATGFVAGGVSALFGKDVDAVETRCLAKGDPFCVIEVGLPEIIDAKRKEIWSELDIT